MPLPELVVRPLATALFAESKTPTRSAVPGVNPAPAIPNRVPAGALFGETATTGSAVLPVYGAVEGRTVGATVGATGAVLGRAEGTALGRVEDEAPLAPTT